MKRRVLAAVMIVIVSFIVMTPALAWPRDVPVYGYIGEDIYDPDAPPTDDPPGGDPSTDDPPGDDPSTDDPPGGDPSADDPSGGDPQTDPPADDSSSSTGGSGAGSLASPRTGDDADITRYLLTLLLAIVLLVLLWWRRDEKPLKDG